MIKSKSKYYRWNLKTPEAKSVYDTLLAGLEARKRLIVIDTQVLTRSYISLADMIRFVELDNPGLFYVDFHEVVYSTNPYRTNVEFGFLFSDDKIDSTQDRMKHAIDLIVQKVSMSRLEPYIKEIVLHDYLVDKVKYEHEDSSYHKAHSAVGAILHGRAVCEGYSKAFKLLCDSCKVPSIIVFGTADANNVVEGHAWNIVKLDGKCYHVDVTWDNGAMFKGKPSYNCFNLSDLDINSDHDWDKELLPKCTSMDDNYYVRSGLYMTSKTAFNAHLVAGLKKGLRNFSMKINHQFEDEAKLQEIITEAVESFTVAKLLGYSYTMQYDQKRDVVNLSIEIRP